MRVKAYNSRGIEKCPLNAGTNLRTATYTPNLLNQYTSRTIPSAFDVMGLADATATISINGSSAGVYRKGDYYQKPLTVANSSVPVWQSVTVSSSAGGSVGPGYVFVPKTPEAPTHDLDGNLTVDGRWNYTWDAENRLVKKETKTDAPTGSKRRLDFEYDYMGRRIKKVVTNLDTSQVIDEIRFVYAGWNLIAQLNANLTPRRSFVWGLDLSGSMQGAGGVGGLLMVREHANGTYHFVGYDGNGNVATLIESANGTASATYEYGPFGEPVRVSGTMAKLNPLPLLHQILGRRIGPPLLRLPLLQPNHGEMALQRSASGVRWLKYLFIRRQCATNTP